MNELTTHEVQNISGGTGGGNVEDLPVFGRPVTSEYAPLIGIPVTAESVNQPLLDGQPKADLV